ncbi:MAG: hypothetical protein WCT27_03655 [Patescibacteria group bacterium]|jgi:hypothetical protein
MAEQKKQADEKKDNTSQSRDMLGAIQKVKLQLWLGLGGIIVVGLAITAYFIFLKSPSAVVPKGLDDSRCQNWTPGVCAGYSFGGSYFDAAGQKCQEFSGGSVCAQPPFVSLADCEAVCIRGEAEHVQAVDVNAVAARDDFDLDCTVASGTFKVGDDTGAVPGSDGSDMGLGRCHIANTNANTKHIALVWQIFIDGKVWYTSDMRFPDPVAATFAKELAIASGYDNGVFSYKPAFTLPGEYKLVFSVYDCAEIEKEIKGDCSNSDETKNADIVAKVTTLQSIEKTFTVNK